MVNEDSLPGGHSRSAGRRPESSATNSRLMLTERSDRRLGRSATRTLCK